MPVPTSLEIQGLLSQPEGLFVIASNVAITRWLNAAALTLIIYDSLLTLRDDFRLNWPRRLGLIKILIILNRIVSVVVIALNGWVFAALYRSFSDQFCTAIILSTGFGALFAFGTCNWILLSRTKVLLGNSKLYNRCLSIYYAIVYGVTSGLVVRVSLALRDRIFYSQTLATCGIVGRPREMGFIWVGPMMLELTIFLITAIRLYRQRATEHLALSSRLILVLHRDGMCYYFIILGLRVYLLLSWMILPISSSFIGMFLLWSIMSVGATRLQHNLVRAAFPVADLRFTGVTKSGSINTALVHTSLISLPHPNLRERGLIDQWEMSGWNSSSTVRDPGPYSTGEVLVSPIPRVHS